MGDCLTEMKADTAKEVRNSGMLIATGACIGCRTASEKHLSFTLDAVDTVLALVTYRCLGHVGAIAVNVRNSKDNEM